MLRESDVENDVGVDGAYSGIQGSFSREPSTYDDQQSLLLGQSHSMILGDSSLRGSVGGGQY